jgi:riboflavin biosynthesis pyrimidine reductase
VLDIGIGIDIGGKRWLIVRRLIPDPGPEGAEPELAAAYAYPDREGPWLRGSMVSSVDGVAQADGRSGGLSGPADVAVFHTLRDLADVVLVGASTVRVEGYGPASVREESTAPRAAAAQTPVPAIAVVSASLDVDFDSPLYATAAVPTITVTVADAPPARIERARAAGEVLIAGASGHVDLPQAVALLARSGRRKLLCEGGPKLLAAAVAAGCVNELCLSISPQLRAGTGLRILDAPELATPAALELHGLLTQDGFLFARYLLRI